MLIPICSISKAITKKLWTIFCVEFNEEHFLFETFSPTVDILQDSQKKLIFGSALWRVQRLSKFGFLSTLSTLTSTIIQPSVLKFSSLGIFPFYYVQLYRSIRHELVKRYSFGTSMVSDRHQIGAAPSWLLLRENLNLTPAPILEIGFGFCK